MSGYLCKVRQKKAQELELKWALEAAQKKAAAIAAQMAQQAQMEAYADAMLGQTSFNSPTQILGAGKPLFNIAPPADPYRLQRMVLLGAGAFLAISGLAITAVGLLAVGVLVLEAIGVTTELTPLGLVLDLPHLGMGMVFAGVGTLLGLGVTALGVDMIYQAVRPEPPFSTLFPWQHSSEEP